MKTVMNILSPFIFQLPALRARPAMPGHWETSLRPLICSGKTSLRTSKTPHSGPFFGLPSGIPFPI